MLGVVFLPVTYYAAAERGEISNVNIVNTQHHRDDKKI